MSSIGFDEMNAVRFRESSKSGDRFSARPAVFQVAGAL
jgi:hypothetical protein